MKISEIRGMGTKDIEEELDATQEELMRLRFQQTTGELTDHNLLKFARRKIARLLTVLKEREAEQESEGEA